MESIRNYSALQASLVHEFRSKYAYTNYDDLRSVQSGELFVDGVAWGFRRHGVGVEFRSPDGIVVDANFGMFEAPDGVSGWRLMKYFESIGVRTVNIDNSEWMVEEEGGVVVLLEYMERKGVLQRAERGLYRLVHA